MVKDKLAGHLAIAATYTIFGLNLIFCKDIANAEAVSPIVLFTLRAAGASALFWLLSLFLPGERIAKGDMWKIALASFTGLFVPQTTFLYAITMATPLDTGILGTLGPIFTMFFAFLFLKEPITLKKAGGVVISFVGVLLLVLNSVHHGGAASTT
ncbi:MAG: DMT family transporter, partial [Bacteroidales bacterium]|nr:DMT family transporter [Bacteroidales bacterium]